MEYRLDELFDLQMGKTPARKNPEYWNSNDYKWISIADLSKCEKYITETKEHISSIAVQESGISEIPANTVIMSFKLSIGKTAITKEPIYSNEAIMSFRDKGVTTLLPDYIYYMFSGSDWSKGSNTAVMGTTLNKATLSQIRIYVHAYEDQKRIVELLDKVSSIISKRKQELVELDDLIKARFVEMFGDTFSNPKRWPTKTFREASLRLSDGPFGSNLKSEHYSENGVRVIRLGNIGVGKFIDKDQSYVSLDHYERLKKYTCKPGEIVIGTLGEPNLRACIIPDYVKLAVNKADCVHYVPDSKILENSFVCQYINCPTTLLLASNMVHGQTRARVSSGQIAKMPIFIPPLSLQQQFADFVAQIDKSKATVQKALDETQLLFDSLMQQYFG